ncbi:MAG: tetratricopeptide repeat protein [Lutibacter sp.]|uniref:tetratricopeptide repeat protein n=1 Tax=Lutibacter sp. TaxID=1925666 RepID=UPI0017CD4056|nr:tetratricopeptide repeat protein [Lutibacter sp.]MBT8317824.1 tetratricopeptide repeat protein [Lutibacter sp.]NNJ58682.1 tetratricopeptide repeat protein [Lutibacter sp.]
MNIKNFLKECNDKEVFKKLSIYIVSSWVLIQVLAVTWEPLGLSKKSVTYLLIILLIGFPINIFLVWRYHLVGLDYKNKKLNEEGNLVKVELKNSPFHKMYFYILGIISVLSFLSALLIIQNNFSTPKISDKEESINNLNDKIAVLRFGNNTGDEKYDIIGKMTSDWIIHGISENNVGQVISPEIIDNYLLQINNASDSSAPIDNKSVINEYFNAGKLISGNFYLENEKLLFQGTITNSAEDTQLISFKLIECDSKSPLECIEKLNQLILGFLITEENKKANLQPGSPPKFEAYKYLYEAKATIDDPIKYVELLDKSIEADSNYFEPKVERVAHYFNTGDFKKSDSLLKTINPTSFANLRQQNLLNMYEALLRGQNDKVYYYSKKEYDITPFDLSTNSGNMTIALQFVNKPEDVIAIFNEISTKGMEIENCAFCKDRIYIKALSEIELGNYDDAIDLLTEINKTVDENQLKKPLFSALIRSGENKEVEDLISKLEYKEFSEIQELYLYIGNEYLLLKSIDLAEVYFNKLIQSASIKQNDENLALAYFYNQNFKKAKNHFERVLKKDPLNAELLSKLASSQFKNNQHQESEETLKKIRLQQSDYQFGTIDYALAQYYATIREDNKVFEHLTQAVAHGYLFTPNSYMNDPIFVDYFNDDRFKNVLNFWH